MERGRGQAIRRGPEPEFTDDDPRDAVQALLCAADGSPGAAVVTVGPDGATTRQTYPELLSRARRLLTGLRGNGLRPGDALVLCGLPLDQFFPAFWAAVLGGARPVAVAERPGDGTAALERLRHTCDLLDGPLVLSDAAGAATLARTARELRVAVAEDCLRGAPAYDHTEPAGSDVALLMLSSGSTGVPKAAQLTHRGLADFAASSRRILDVRPGHTMLNWLPVDHSGAFLLYHVLAVFTGCTNVHAPTGHVVAEPLRWLDLLEEHRAEHSWAPTFAYQLVSDALAERPGGGRRLDHLRTLVCGGEQIALPVLRRFLAATAAYGVREEHIVPAWGMAETVTGITYGRLDRPGTVQRILRSSLGGPLVAAAEHTPDEDCVTFVAVGSPAHGTTLRLVDDAGEPVAENRIGRLQVRSQARVTPGYVRDPKADAAAFPGEGGWLDTGDLAFFAEDQLVITGRRKDLIILNGHNISCHEVEDAATAVTGVRTGDVAACGVPDPDSGTETLAVFFVSRGAREDARIEKELKSVLYARLRLTASHVVPVPPDAFPRTPAGKVRRGDLRDRLAAGGPTALAPAVALPHPDEVSSAVQEELNAVLGRPVAAHVPFYELGLNSVKLVRLRVRLEERLGREIAQTVLFEHPTAADLAAHLAAVPGSPAGTAADAAPRAAADAGTGAATRRQPGEDAGTRRTPVADAGGDPAAGADHRIAVIGMSVRFPGAGSTAKFWANLRDGVDSVRRFTPHDLVCAGLSAEEARATDRVPVAGVLDGVEEFDADFFGVSPREAGLTHPAHRLFLECCHEALEDGGYAATGPGTRVGVFAGSGMNLYGHQQPPASSPDDGDPATGMQTAIGQQPDFLASRVAYRLGLTGPAIGVQTACSTSLVAVHLAVQALLSGDTDLALAGAAAVHTPQETGYRSHPGSILSPTGRCRAFDADADGTVGGNGVAAVLLKRLDRALADGDTVHAVILGSAVNNDGAGKVGFSAPGVAGQVEVVRQALRRAAVPADTVSYVEAHGTGTRLGDPVEFEALARALGEDTDRTGFCTVGSVKPAIGHLDSCAGMAGLVKTVLMLEHRTLVPTLNLDRPNPELRLSGGPLALGTATGPWRTRDGVPRRAGVSALGVGGTNAHVILQEAPERPEPAGPGPGPADGPVLVPLSARDPQALDEYATRLREHLLAHPGLAAADVAATLALGRPHREARTAVVGRTARDLARALESPPGPVTPLGPVAFACSGQGSARRGMARGIWDAYPEARRVLERCERVHADEFGGTLLPLLLGADGEDRGDDGEDDGVWPTDTAQPALFAHHMALIEVWRAFGVRPALLLGHSLGEYAALCAGGALLLEDGLRLTARRGGLMREAAAPGGMLAVRTDAATAERIACAAGAEPAACNGPRSQVISGSERALEEAARLLADEDIPWRALPVDRAFHSAALDEALRAFRAYAEKTTYAPLHTPLASGLDGALRPAGWTVDAEYLCRQARQPVRFDRAVAAASAQGCADFLEIGAGSTLAGLGRHCAPESRWYSGQGEGAEQPAGITRTLGELYRAGAALDWRAVVRSGGRVPLPGHPLRRRRVNTTVPARAAAGPAAGPGPVAVPVPAPVPVPVPALTGHGPVQSGELLDDIRRLTAQKLGTDIADTSPDASFFALGADSLALMGMVAELESRHGVRVRVRDLFSDADTPRKLAAHVADLRGDGAAESSVQPAAASPGEPLAAAASPPASEPAAPPASEPAAPPAFVTAVPPAAVPAVAGPDGRAAAPPAVDESLHQLFTQQIRLAENLVEQVTGLLTRQLDALPGAQPASPASPTPPAQPVVPALPAPLAPPAAAPQAVRPEAPPRPEPARPGPLPHAAHCDVSLYFFGDYPQDADGDKYALIMEAAAFADRHGFHALWFPERHFNSFGALFPNPSVLAAALAARTDRIRLHAGSVVLPLHHPVRVAEEWSVVDNLSGGRAGLCFASGWHATDFALAPENFGRHRDVMYERLEDVRRLWSGQPLPVTAGDGTRTEVRLHPRPVQAEPPLYVAVVGNPDSYRQAAARDLGVVTNLMAQTVEQLAENIALYRRTRAEHGLDPDAGRVVVLVHTYLGEDAQRARAEAYAPFVSYLRSSLSLFDQVTNSLGFEVDLENTPEDDVEFLLGRAYERYCDSRALIGDEDTAAATVRRLVDAGADEIACFVDFGVPAERVLAALPVLDRLRQRQIGRAGTGKAPGGGSTDTTGHEGRRTPLSPAQRRIWFLEQLHPGTSMYHEPKAVRLEGPLNTEALRWALQQVCDRHPALRTVFREADGVPYQEILPHVRLDCPVADHTGDTEEAALRAAMESEGRRIFDLSDGALVSARLLRLAHDRHLLFLLAHHIVFDSSSTTVFTRDLGAFYRAWPHHDDTAAPPVLPPLPVLPAVPPDPARTAEALAHWRRELGGAPELALPTDRPRPAARSGEGASLTYELDAELTEGLRRLAAEHRATLFMVLTSAIGAVLGRFSGQRDVVIGTAVAARPAGAEHHIGLFLDTVPLRLDLSGDPDFGELLRRVRESSTAAFEYRDVPFDELVGALNPHRDAGRNPLFQVLVEYENEGQAEFDPPRLTATLLDMPSERAPFDLTLYLTHHREGVRCAVEYDTVLFDASTVRRLLAYVESVLRRALETATATLPELTALTGADRAALSRLGRLDEPAPAHDDTLHGLFEAQARRTPDATALVHGDERIGYAELDRRAERLARQLRARGAGRGERVAVLLPRGPELITALLGVLKSGAAYLPLDVSLPTARLELLLDDGTPALLLTTPALLDRNPSLAARPVHLTGGPETAAGDGVAGGADTSGPLVGPRPQDPAYCIYTSGSTGRPKGVVVPHRGPVGLVRGHLERHPALRTLQWTSPAFDVSVQEIFTTLAAGAELVLVDDDVRLDPAAVAEAVRRHAVERVFMPCTPLRYLMETGPELPSLRELFSAGEALELTAGFRRFLAAHPRCTLYNQYGPTETSVIVTSHRVDGAEERPPIGTPVAGAGIRLLDTEGRPVPLGAVGEIHVSGTPVAYGYHARPEETAAAFVTDDTGAPQYRTGDLARWRSDGTLAYLGRADDQVKIRGHRVEPGEIQVVLNARPEVAEAAVVARRDRAGEAELVACVAPVEPDTDLGRLRSALAAELPDHLVPRHWVRVDRLPVNASGKLDRERLPAPDAGAPQQGAEPVTPLEKDLHELWCAELGLPHASVTRSFFELGGHSLSAIRLLNRMSALLGAELGMAEFFRAPTIRAVAARCEEHRSPVPSTEAQAPAPAAGVVATVPMTSSLRRLWRRHHEHTDPGVYNVAHRIDLHGALDTDALKCALRDLVARHEALRSRAVHRDGHHLLEVLAEVPVDVGVTDLTASADDETRIERWCQDHASEPFALDCAPLFRFRIGRLGADRWVLVTVLHHAVCDGWSMGIIWHDLQELYNARSEGAAPALAPPPAQFTDVARAEHRLTDSRRAALERFWRIELAGLQLGPALPCDRPRPDVPSGRGALHTWVIGGTVPADAAETAERLGVTPYAVLAAAFATWTARLCGRTDDIVLAASSANRARPEREGVVGLLGDAVLLRARLSEAPAFADLVTRLGSTLFTAIDHQDLPLTEVVRLVSPETADGLFPTVLFTVVTTPPPALDLRAVSTTVRGLPTRAVARNELYAVLVPRGDTIDVTFEYATDLFDAATVRAWSEDFTALLAQVTAEPSTPVAQLLRPPEEAGTR
ncbi:natural product biosynthesis luciferase-like monooxygenase protein/amino acid adenylation domain-containing protein [Streptomyces sp. V4I23]|uniref:non-ribosomal peptide synthetase/type I polyketide synthase n=1 Tax=Streptomyces sp. V4I23 TaxID=3042282 RepID=UPI002784560A|nr:non-ribosomal peptide synthetase/type I polyketide synthase [Streptomyces sp. V4I23]MDQ1006648.1 natural product biosynthesis luciferase-like monooxygenase protein/amino acid adenylation domain-containing protein [Streptomyces sp. V4I23]